MDNNVLLSVVIITHNKLDYLRAVLKNLENQTQLENIEFIVIDDGSSDGTKEFLNFYHTTLNLKHESIKNSGSAVARNTGVKASIGENILFLDDDIIIEAEYIAKLLISISNNHRKVHAGNLRLIPLKTVPAVIRQLKSKGTINEKFLEKYSYLDAIYGTLQVAFKNNHASDISCWWGLATGGNLCFPRSILQEIGLFDENFVKWGPEDVDLTYRAFKKGFKLKFNTNNHLYHLDHSRNSNEIQESMAKNVSILLKKYQKSKEILAYVNFFNGMISLQSFNNICDLTLNINDHITLEEYYVSLNYYIQKGQMINWKKNESD